MDHFKQIERLFENAPIGIFETTPEGKFLDLNNELVRILGYESKEDVFNHIESLENDLYEKPEMRHEMLQTIEGKKELSIFEYRFKKKNQSVIDVRLSIRPFWNEDLNKFNNIGIVEDITELKKAQKQQEEQESRYKLLFENSNDAILIYNYNQLLEFNDKALDIYGARNDPDFIKSFNNLNPHKQPDGRLSEKAAKELINKCLEGKPQFFEWVHLKADGTPFYAEVSLSKIPGKEEGLHQAIIRDIDDNKNALFKVSESEEKYRNIVELSPDGIITLTKTGTILSVNSAFVAMTGFEESDFINKHFTKIPTLMFQDYNTMVVIFRKITSSKHNDSLEFRWKHKSGDIRYGDAKIKRIKSANKETIIQGVIRDITDRILLKNELIERESVLRSVIDSTSTEMWVIDFEGTIIAQSGFSKKRWGDLTSKELNSFPDQKLVEHFKVAPIDDIKKGKVVEKEIDVEYENQIKHIKAIWSPYKVHKKIKGYVVYSYDLTAEKELRKKLEAHQRDLELEVKKRTEEITALNSELLISNDYLSEINKELESQKEELQEALETLRTTQSQLIQSEKMASIGVLTSGIAHEINNPINFISNGVVGLKMALDDLIEYVKQRDLKCVDKENGTCKPVIKKLRENYRVDRAMTNIPKLMQPIQNGITRTTEIIKGLRTFSRLDNEEKTIANIQEIIDSTLVILRNKYKNRIEIELDLAPQIELLCYPGKLGQVILNITLNAIQAIEDKGTIKIKTEVNKQKELFQFKISDTGHGMDEQTVAKIFDPFYTTKPVGIGTGIGLSIVHGIIEDHNGQINVKSEPGKGTTFTIKVPMK